VVLELDSNISNSYSSYWKDIYSNFGKNTNIIIVIIIIINVINIIFINNDDNYNKKLSINI